MENRMVKEGDRMVKSLISIFNRAQEERKIPKQCTETAIESICKGGQRENLNETQRGIFMINAISIAYERVSKIQNQKLQEKMSNMQVAGKKNRSIVHNTITNAIMEKQKLRNKNMYILHGPENGFDKLWLKDSLTETKNLGYSKIGTQILYELNKNTEIITETPVGKTDTTNINEVVKQVSIFDLVIKCASTSKVNNINEKVQYN